MKRKMKPFCYTIRSFAFLSQSPRSTRYFLNTVAIFSMFSIVIGCTQSVSSPYSTESVENLKEVPFATTNHHHPELEWNSLLSHLKELTIITPEGYEISIEKENFLKTFSESPFRKPEKSEIKMSAPLTVLLRSEKDEPVALLVSKEGVKWEGNFYRDEQAMKLSHYIKEASSRFFFQSFGMERIVLTSRDLDRTVQITDQIAADIYSMLKKAEYIPGPPRLQYPLFPFYTMDLYAKEKDAIPIEVVSPTLISVKNGEERTYYQTKDSLYSALKKEIGFVDYPEMNPKYLFRSLDLQITDQTIPYEKKTLKINPEEMNEFEAKSLIHTLVRELAEGKQMVGWKKEHNLPSLTIQFLLKDSTESVFIYPDYFIFQEKAFSRSNILEDLKAYILKEKLFSEKKK